MDCDVDWLRAMVRVTSDFPSRGVRHVDINPILGEADAFRCVVELIADELVGRRIDTVMAVAPTGLLIGAPLACRLGCGLVPVHEPGILPGRTQAVQTHREGSQRLLEIQQEALRPEARVVVVDAVLGTGRTASAVIELCAQAGAVVESACFVLAAAGMGGRAHLASTECLVALGEL